MTILKAIWNGAAFYIEVFAVRYVRKFKDPNNDSITPSSTPDISPVLKPVVRDGDVPPVVRLKKDE